MIELAWNMGDWSSFSWCPVSYWCYEVDSNLYTYKWQPEKCVVCWMRILCHWELVGIAYWYCISVQLSIDNQNSNYTEIQYII